MSKLKPHGGHAVGTVRNNKREIAVKPIKFKAHPTKPPYRFLSNLYGDAELIFMEERAAHPLLKALYRKIRLHTTNGRDHISPRWTYEDFKTLRKRLGRPKKETDVYKTEYKGKTFIAWGLIGKLISGCFRKSMNWRLEVVNELVKKLISTSEFPEAERTEITRFDFSHAATKLSAEEKAALDAKRGNESHPPDDRNKEKAYWMMTALRAKYKDPFYRQVLLDTGDAPLEELPDRNGKHTYWSGPGGKLGELLMVVREELAMGPGDDSDDSDGYESSGSGRTSGRRYPGQGPVPRDRGAGAGASHAVGTIRKNKRPLRITFTLSGEKGRKKKKKKKNKKRRLTVGDLVVERQRKNKKRQRGAMEPGEVGVIVKDDGSDDDDPYEVERIARPRRHNTIYSEREVIAAPPSAALVPANAEAAERAKRAMKRVDESGDSDDSDV